MSWQKMIHKLNLYVVGEDRTLLSKGLILVGHNNYLSINLSLFFLDLYPLSSTLLPLYF